MTAPETDLMTNCPVDIEELAAFIDGRLTPERRAQVIEHLDTCIDCRDIVMTADEMATAEQPVVDNVVRGKFWTRVATPAAAAAAMATWLFLGPLNKSGMEKLVAASATLEQRPLATRFSADFPHKPYSPKRGHGDEDQPSDVTVAPEAVYKVADVDQNASATELHAAGVAWMHIPDREKLRYAVHALQRAAAKKPDDAAILTDLSAAYYAVGEYKLALKNADLALAKKETPTAIWNRALALNALSRTKDEQAAWKRYLVLDPESAWAVEVRDRYLE